MFVRKDLPLADQLVQVGHVCQTAGKEFDIPNDCHMVLIGINSANELYSVMDLLESKSIDFVSFYEPDSMDESDIPMGITALCTRPITKQEKKCFSLFPLWKL